MCYNKDFLFKFVRNQLNNDLFKKNLNIRFFKSGQGQNNRQGQRFCFMPNATKTMLFTFPTPFLVGSV